MANEFQHKDPGATLTQAEYITTDGTGHIFDSQAQGDIVYASSATVLSRLGKSGTTTHALLNSGTNNNPAWALIPLASAVTGTLPVANGGTGITSLATGVATFLGTSSSANLRAALTDETGTGGAVFATSPTLVTPALGTPSALVATNASGTASSLTSGNVTTNANLTGVVTSTGNATAIANKALAIAKIADGTDGELITWNASGVIAAVAVGSADQVLTSNGSGAAPTFKTGAVDVLSIAKFWVKYDGGGTTVNASFNVGSVSNPGTGDHTVTISTDFSSANWCATMAARTAGTNYDIRVETMAAGSLRVLSGDGSGAAASTYECIAGFGAQ